MLAFIRRVMTMLALLAALLVTFPAAALAEAHETADSVDWFNLGDSTNTVRLIGFLIPVLTALLTKSTASSGLKAVVTLVLTTLTATTAVLAGNDGGYHWQEFVNAFWNTMAPAIVLYYGLLKPTRVTDKLNTATAGFGLGPRPALEATTDRPRSSTDDAGGY